MVCVTVPASVCFFIYFLNDSPPSPPRGQFMGKESFPAALREIQLFSDNTSPVLVAAQKLLSIIQLAFFPLSLSLSLWTCCTAVLFPVITHGAARPPAAAHTWAGSLRKRQQVSARCVTLRCPFFFQLTTQGWTRDAPSHRYSFSGDRWGFLRDFFFFAWNLFHFWRFIPQDAWLFFGA